MNQGLCEYCKNGDEPRRLHRDEHGNLYNLEYPPGPLCCPWCKNKIERKVERVAPQK